MAREALARFADRFPQRPTIGGAPVVDALEFVRQYHLDDREPIRSLAASLTARPDARGLAQLNQLLRPFREFHRDHPHVTAPRNVLTGPIILGNQTADDRPIGLTTDDINLHGTIVGPSGSGKTNILLTIARWLLMLRILLAVIDVKEDFGWLLREPDVLLIDEHTRWNFLITPPFLTAAEHRNEIIDQILARFFGRELQRQLLEEGWERATRATPNFSLADLADAIAAGGGRETPSHAEARRSCVARLRRFTQHALFTTRADGIPWETLLNRTFVVRSTGFDDLARFQFDLLARYCFLHNRAARMRSLHRVLLIDESYELLSEAQDGIRSIETLPRLKQLAREFGIGVLTTSVTLRGISELAQASTHFTIALPPNNQEDAHTLIRTLGLTTEQADHFLHKLHRGEALLRIGSWPEVIHLQIPPNTERKHATPDDITDARARTNTLAPMRPMPFTAPRVNTAAAREGSEGNGQPTPAHNPAPSSSPPARVAPAVEQPRNTKTIALNKHATAILNDAAEHPYTLTTPCFTRCSLRLSEGERAKTTVANLGFLESHRVRTGAGRGKTGNALRLTPAGYAWLGKRPPKGTRGGDSVQHAFLIHELSRRIPRSTIETLSVDLVVAYNAATHEQLLNAIAHLSERPLALNTGDVVALEVECSRPELTGPRNAARNEGFALTIIATLGQTEALQQTIGAIDRVVILDVLRLLDALRS